MYANFESFASDEANWDMEKDSPCYRFYWVNGYVSETAEIDEVSGTLAGCICSDLFGDFSDEQLMSYFKYSSDELAAMAFALDPDLRIERI